MPDTSTVAPGDQPTEFRGPGPDSTSLAPLDYVRSGFFAATGVAVLGLIVLACWKLGIAILDVITPFAAALVLALMLDPLVDRIEARGWSRAVGVSLIFGGFLFILVALGMYLVPSLMAQASQLSNDGPAYIDKGRDYVNHFLAAHRKIGTMELPKNVQALSSQFSDKISETMQGALGRVAGLLLGSFHVIVDVFVTLISTFYLLMDIDRLRARAFYFAPERARAPLAHYAGEVASVFASYVRGLVIVCALYGVTTAIIFYALGRGEEHAIMRHYALLLGVTAGFLFAVPYVGTISTALIGGIMGLVAGGPGYGAITVGIIIVLNQIYDHIITPRVIGGGVGLHPVLTVFALVLGGELFGLPGLLLSVPMAASIQVILFGLFPKLKSPTPVEFLRAQQPHLPADAVLEKAGH